MNSDAFAFEPITALDAPTADWVRLANASRNIFSTWEWASIWWRHFGGEKELASVSCRSSAGVVAILPLYFWSSRPARVLRFVGHGPGDELGPVCGAEDRALAAEAISTYLAELGDAWDVLLAEQLPGVDPWASLLAGRSLRHEGSPVLKSEGDGWEAYLYARSPNFRQQVRRRERNLQRRYELRYRLACDSERLDRDLDILFELHNARWRARSAFGGDREQFHREFAACALERGWLRIWFLELDAKPVAAWYGFRFGGVESYYQAGRDPAWDAASVGFVLLAHSIRAAFDDGIREYRFLRGDEAYKLRFATEDRKLLTVATPRSVRGRALVAGASVLRATPRLRKMLRRPLGA